MSVKMNLESPCIFMVKIRFQKIGKNSYVMCTLTGAGYNMNWCWFVLCWVPLPLCHTLNIVNIVIRAYAGLILGRCGLQRNWGGGGLPHRKLITFDPFVNSTMVIVNFLDFVYFFLLIFSQFFFTPRLAWGGDRGSAPLTSPCICALSWFCYFVKLILI